MANNNFPERPGLTEIPGVRIAYFESLRRVICPFCANADVVYLSGKVSFSAEMSGNDLFDGEPQSLAAFLCPNSHIFFLREPDIVPAKSSRTAA
jgi:hypothetical protein